MAGLVVWHFEATMAAGCVEHLYMQCIHTTSMGRAQFDS